MKLSTFSLLLGLCLLFSNCSSDDDSSSEFLRASIETISFDSSGGDNAVTGSLIDSGDEITFLVQGTNDSADIMILLISDYQGVGTYDVGTTEESSGTASFTESSSLRNWSSNSEGGSGTIMVTEETANEVNGTFEFMGVEGEDQSSSRSVTNGSFRAGLD